VVEWKRWDDRGRGVCDKIIATFNLKVITYLKLKVSSARWTLDARRGRNYGVVVGKRNEVRRWLKRFGVEVELKFKILDSTQGCEFHHNNPACNH
jgi:hypothetical protein